MLREESNRDSTEFAIWFVLKRTRRRSTSGVSTHASSLAPPSPPPPLAPELPPTPVLPDVPPREGWAYLAVVLDLASRRVVGWAVGDSRAAALALDAVRMALEERQPAPGLVHHSDRGVQYACTAYRELLAAHGVEVSMSRRGNCWDNAVAESFFATVERELIDRRDWPTRDAAARAIFDYIAGWYNTRRLHSTLNYQSPAAYERHLARAA